jgi:hypothetical protein
MLRHGPCNNKLFSAAIDILNELTGEKWGFVQWKRKVSYVTSEKIKIKFGAEKSKNMNHILKTRPIGTEWKSDLRLEICAALLKHSREHQTINVSKLVDTRLVADDYGNDISLDNCKEFNAYQNTFVHARTDWIARETIVLDSTKVLYRDDYM